MAAVLRGDVPNTIDLSLIPTTLQQASSSTDDAPSPDSATASVSNTTSGTLLSAYTVAVTGSSVGSLRTRDTFWGNAVAAAAAAAARSNAVARVPFNADGTSRTRAVDNRTCAARAEMAFRSPGRCPLAGGRAISGANGEDDSADEVGVAALSLVISRPTYVLRLELAPSIGRWWRDALLCRPRSLVQACVVAYEEGEVLHHMRGNEPKESYQSVKRVCTRLCKPSPIRDSPGTCV